MYDLYMKKLYTLKNLIYLLCIFYIFIIIFTFVHDKRVLQIHKKYTKNTYILLYILYILYIYNNVCSIYTLCLKFEKNIGHT